MARIIVEYNPGISKEAQKLIREEITPSMVSNDETSGQYEISEVEITLTKFLDELDGEPDLLLIRKFVNEGVHYIEF